MELESDNLTCLALKPNQLRFSGSGSVSFPHSINTQKTKYHNFIYLLSDWLFIQKWTKKADFKKRFLFFKNYTSCIYALCYE